MPDFAESLKTFAQAADLQTVVSIAVLTYLVQITALKKITRSWREVIVWVPFLLSFVLTPIMSSAEEAMWGGKYYYRSVVYNGAVGLFAWRVVLPQIKAKFPHWFMDSPTTGNGHATDMVVPKPRAPRPPEMR